MSRYRKSNVGLIISCIFIGLLIAAIGFSLTVLIASSVNEITFGAQIVDWFGSGNKVASLIPHISKF